MNSNDGHGEILHIMERSSVAALASRRGAHGFVYTFTMEGRMS